MIREMKAEDFDTLNKMGSDMCNESSYKVMKYDFGKVANLFANVVESDSLLGLVTESGGEITGFMMAFAEEHYFSRDMVSCDLMLYVKPDCRGGTHAYRMLSAYIQWAKSKGVKDIRIGITTGLNEEKTARLYNKCGFERCGSLFSYKGE
jgi:GNAT superfamily N-acetyltransferase